jgi:glucose-6-phosphate isomerase
VTVATQQELVERIWARDATVWTGADEDKWLGWLDEPKRMQERAGEIVEFAAEARTKFETLVLLGMGGSSLAPEVLKRTFGAKQLHVLDTTHPAMIRHAEKSLDLSKTMFIVSSKSGGTLETLSHFEYFWEKTGAKGEQFVAITDPGSGLEQLAKTRNMRVFAGEPTIGGRYSALSPFGVVPAALMGIDVDRVLANAERMAEACRGDANPGLQLGLQLGERWREGRDKVCIAETDGRFGLWAEQLIAESTGKQGRGLVPAPGESPAGPDRQGAEVEMGDANEIGAEFFRWEFAIAVAGAILQINPFDQPDVQAAKDKTKEVLASGEDPGLEPEGSLDELLARAKPPNYIAIQAFIDPMREPELQPLIERGHETGCVVTHGLGPRYLHSTGQLHKGGPPTGLFVQVVDDTGEEIPIPGEDFGFGRLIRAQAEGDYRSLQQRGRPIVRVRLEDS